MVNAPPLLELPFNYPRQSQTSYRKNSLSFNLSKSCTDSLRELSEQSDTNLSITLLAASNTLLYRYTHQEDILVASPVTSLGFSITGKLLTNPPNTIIIRTDLSGIPAFWSYLNVSTRWQGLLMQIKICLLNCWQKDCLPSGARNSLTYPRLVIPSGTLLIQKQKTIN